MRELEPTREQSEMLSDAKTFVSMGSMLLSYMMFRCRFVFTDEPSLYPAAAVVTPTENIIALHPGFFSGLDNTKQRAFLVLHEVLHIFLHHGQRGRDNPETNLKKWGYAIDYSVNATCSGAYKNGDRVGYNQRYQKYFECPVDGLFDEKYVGLAAEEIYKLLPDGTGGTGGGSGFDVHVVSEDDTAEQVRKNDMTMVAAATNAEMAKSIGNNEMALVSAIKDMMRPKIDWRDHLHDAIMSRGDTHTTYNRLSRRTSGRVVFPTFHGETIKVIFGVDSSGSMGYNDFCRVRGELYGILEQFDSWEVTVVSCDTKEHILGKFSSEEGDDFSSASVDFVGGGGTDMIPIVEYANRVNEDEGDINACIILTDGYIPTRVDDFFDENITNLVIVTDGGNKNLSLNNCTVIQTGENL